MESGKTPEGTKLEIMNLLLRHELSARSLAAELGVSPTAIRQHLDTLYARGLVARRKVVTGTSRPAFVYRLSPEGTGTFPKRYDLLLSLFVDVLLERHGVEWVAVLVQEAAQRLVQRVRPRFGDGDPERRWQRLVEWLEEELGWHADVRMDDGHHEVVIHQCPFREVSRTQPAVCGVFFRTLIHALYADVNVEHVGSVTGPACCQLRVARVGP